MEQPASQIAHNQDSLLTSTTTTTSTTSTTSDIPTTSGSGGTLSHATSNSTHDRFIGALIGLAVGDAVGTTGEFTPRKDLDQRPIQDMVGKGPFRLKPGEWTDDTSMALCMTQTLNEKRCFDRNDVMGNFIQWWKQGHLSSTGKCFDIGRTTREALTEYRNTRDINSCGRDDPNSKGNGSLMRLAPVPLYFRNSPRTAINVSGLSSELTHKTIECIDACRYFAGLLLGALSGATKEELLSDSYCIIPNYWHQNKLCADIATIAQGSFKHKERDQIESSGFVVHTLEAVLWAFYTTDSFDDGLLRVVNLGDDADTTGAIYGQIAGAYYGHEAIRPKWREQISHRELIYSMSERLYRGSCSLDPELTLEQALEQHDPNKCCLLQPAKSW